MSRLRLCLVALTAILALTAVAASSASAFPQLTAESYPVGFSGSQTGESKLIAGSHEIKCTGATATAEVGKPGTKEQEGTLETTFTGCTSEGVPCKTASMATGEILTGSLVIHFVLIIESGSEHLYGFLVLGVSLEIKCGIVTIRVKGNVLLDLPTLKLNTLVEPTEKVTAEGTATEGKQSFTTCTEPTELCSGGPFSLSAEFVEGKPESAAEVVTATGTFKAMVTPEG